MIKIKSNRARALLENPKYFARVRSPEMVALPHDSLDVAFSLEQENGIVKKLSFSGTLDEGSQVLLESMASLVVGKKISILDQLSVRECEAYLRDRNSEIALESLGPNEEERLKIIAKFLMKMASQTGLQEYKFSSTQGPFRLLKLADKVRELKEFMRSQGVGDIYRDGLRPELVDVEDLTVFVDVSHSSKEDKERFEKLHQLGVETFREENLNFIPEA